MLVLKFDVTCGFENLYLVEKNIEFPLALVKDKELVKKLFNQESKLSEENDRWLLDNYGTRPKDLIKDYDLEEMIKFITRVDVAGSYLYSVCFNREKPIIPGICDLDNIRLEEVDEDEGVFIDRELQTWDNAALAFNCFSNQDSEEDDEFTNWDGKVYQA